MAITILVVDDSPQNRELLRSVLEHCHYEVAEAENGRRAVELARLLNPSLILMDLQMPEMDGYEALAELRMIPELHATPVIAFTAFAMLEDESRAIAAGFSSFIPKPVPLSFLRNEVARFLNKSAFAAGESNR